MAHVLFHPLFRGEMDIWAFLKIKMQSNLPGCTQLGRQMPSCAQVCFCTQGYVPVEPAVEEKNNF